MWNIQRSFFKITFIILFNFQVPRILNPIVNVIEAIPQLVNENKGGLGDLIKKNYGSAEECQIDIMQVILLTQGSHYNPV